MGVMTVKRTFQKPVTLGGFDPDVDPGLLFWHDIADVSGIGGARDSGNGFLSNGMVIHHVNDSSGNGHIVNGVGVLPTFTTNLLNGLPGAVVDSAEYLENVANTIPLNSAVFSFFVLAQTATGSDAFARIADLRGDGQSNGHDNAESFVFATTGGTTQDWFFSYNSGGIGGSLTFGTPKLFSAIFDGANYTVHLGGVSQGSNAATAALGNPTVAMLRYMECRGTLYEAFGSTSNLTSQRTAVEAYFQNKWGTI